MPKTNTVEANRNRASRESGANVNAGNATGQMQPTPRSMHTPGPWFVSQLMEPSPAPEHLTEAQRKRWDEIQASACRPFRHNDGSFNVAAGTGDDRTGIAAVNFHGKAKRGQAHAAPDPEGEANARLIAAAPELLEACKNLLTKHEHPADDVFAEEVARTVIAKAEGRK